MTTAPAETKDQVKAPSKVDQDRQLLKEAQAKGRLATLGAFVRLSGPGWLQSALTLGGGSLASSLYLGVLAGVTMMWLQPLAMVLGIIMLSAIGYVTMSTGERPFRAINRHVNPVLGWSWLLASMAANMVWALPQYSLCYGVLEQNLMPGVLGAGGPLAGEAGKWIISLIVLVISTAIVWSYGSGGWGVKLYEMMLKTVVAMIVICFFGVVVRLSMEGGIDWGAVLAGFVPSLGQLYEPAPAFQAFLSQVESDTVRAYWSDMLVAQQRDVMISAAATAVGINMTFLLPYSMLARGWGKTFRGLGIFDLSTGMLIPFMLATSCVIIASASQFHAQPVPGLMAEDIDGREAVVPPEAAQNAWLGMLEPRLEEELGEEAVAGFDDEAKLAAAQNLPEADRRIAAALVTRDAFDLAKSLERFTGRTVGNWVFGIGVVGMTLSTISLLMLISGFVVCEVLDRPATGWTHRLGCLFAASGVLWPLLWAGEARFWLAVVTSVFGMALLPIAYWTFFLLMNQRTLLGAEMPRGGRRVLWNVLMIIAGSAATFASMYVVWSKTGWYGIGGVAAILALALAVHFNRTPQSDLSAGKA